MDKKVLCVCAMLAPVLLFAADVDSEESAANALTGQFQFAARYYREGLDIDSNVPKTNYGTVDMPERLSVWGHQFDTRFVETNRMYRAIAYHLEDTSTHVPMARIDIKDYSATSNAVDDLCFRLCHSSMLPQKRLASITATNISDVALFSERCDRNTNGWTNNVFAIYGRSSVQVRSSSNAVDIALAVIEAGTRKEEASEKSEDADGDGNK